MCIIFKPNVYPDLQPFSFPFPTPKKIPEDVGKMPRALNGARERSASAPASRRAPARPLPRSGCTTSPSSQARGLWEVLVVDGKLNEIQKREILEVPRKNRRKTMEKTNKCWDSETTHSQMCIVGGSIGMSPICLQFVRYFESDGVYLL